MSSGDCSPRRRGSERSPSAELLVIGERHCELDVVVVAELDARGIRCAEIRGAMTNRASGIEDFRADPDCPVLIGTEVLKRGLHLQFCRFLISVGLPDDPARVDQQIGRIVRPGSSFTVVEHCTVLARCAYERKAAERVLHKEAQAALFLPPDHMPNGLQDGGDVQAA